MDRRRRRLHVYLRERPDAYSAWHHEGALEDVLDPRILQRVHRSTIVNLRRVKSLRAHMNGEYFLTLEGAHKLKMSRTYRDEVEYFLKGSPRG
jgi:hypothetical protein